MRQQNLHHVFISFLAIALSVKLVYYNKSELIAID